MLHKDMYEKIVNCFNPKNMRELKTVKVYVRKISVVNKRFYNVCKAKLRKLKRMDELRLKYNKYNSEENEFPQLLDAVFTGCRLPYSSHSVDKYSSQVKDDIVEIIELMPSSINCSVGTLIYRNNVTVLAAASFNLSIPDKIIQLFLERGADPFKKYDYNGAKITILKDLQEGFKKRLDIIKLFVKNKEVLTI